MRTLSVALVAALVLAVPMAAVAGPAVMMKMNANDSGASAGGSASAGGRDVARDVNVPVPAAPPLPIETPELPLETPDVSGAGASASASASGDVNVDAPVELPAAPSLAGVDAPELPAANAPEVEVPEVSGAELPTADLPVDEPDLPGLPALLVEVRARIVALLGGAA